MIRIQFFQKLFPIGFHTCTNTVISGMCWLPVKMASKTMVRSILCVQLIISRDNMTHKRSSYNQGLQLKKITWLHERWEQYIFISLSLFALTFKNCANARWVLQATLTVSMAFAKLFTYPLYASRTIDLQNCGEEAPTTVNTTKWLRSEVWILLAVFPQIFFYFLYKKKVVGQISFLAMDDQILKFH